MANTETTPIRLIHNSTADALKVGLTYEDTAERDRVKALGLGWNKYEKTWSIAYRTRDGQSADELASELRADRDALLTERGYRLDLSNANVLRLTGLTTIPVAVRAESAMGAFAKRADFTSPRGTFRFDGEQDGYLLYTLTETTRIF